MTRFVQSEDRIQGILLPEYLDDYVAEDNPVRVIDVFVDELDLGALGFDGVIPEATGRPAYHPGALLKIYVYGYVNLSTAETKCAKWRRDNVPVGLREKGLEAPVYFRVSVPIYFVVVRSPSFGVF